jgi:hypothetical protein
MFLGDIFALTPSNGNNNKKNVKLRRGTEFVFNQQLVFPGLLPINSAQKRA